MVKELSFVRKMQKNIKDDYTSILSDGLTSAEYSTFIDTGSYALNALLSGSIYGGFADNKVIGFAGDPATGKTFLKLALEKHFQDQFPEGFNLDYDTESATTKDMISSRGIDPERVIISEPESVEKFRTHCMKFIEAYMQETDPPKCMISLDSLGNLSTEKEVGDITDGKDKRDMTRAQLIRGAFRVLRLKLAKAGIPLIVTNHTYDVIGSMTPTKDQSGGGGFKYAADIIVFLSKKKDWDLTGKTNVVLGNIIHCKLQKSRLTKENSKIDIKLNYQTGLDRYYGLYDIAVKYGIFTKLAKGVEINGKRVFEKELEKNPELYYTTETLNRIDEACKKEFCYGQTSIDEIEDSDGEQKETEN